MLFGDFSGFGSAAIIVGYVSLCLYLFTLDSSTFLWYPNSFLADYVPSDQYFWSKKKEKSNRERFDESLLHEVINKPADGGITALHMAALNGHVESIQLLVDLGASVSEVTVQDGTTIDLIGAGSTPPHYAACGGNAQCRQLLIAKGASLTAENAKGWCCRVYLLQSSFARYMSKQGFDTWILEVRGAGLSVRVSDLKEVEQSAHAVSEQMEDAAESATHSGYSIEEEHMDVVSGDISCSEDEYLMEEPITLARVGDDSKLVTKLTETFM